MEMPENYANQILNNLTGNSSDDWCFGVREVSMMGSASHEQLPFNADSPSLFQEPADALMGWGSGNSGSVMTMPNSKPMDGSVSYLQVLRDDMTENAGEKNAGSIIVGARSGGGGDSVAVGAVSGDAPSTEIDLSKAEVKYKYKWGRKLDSDLDPKHVRRILSNRKSSAKTRAKSQTYTKELEEKVNYLEGEVSRLSPQVSYYHRMRRVQEIENDYLKRRIAFLAGEKVLQDAQYEALKNEKDALCHRYLQQQQQKQQMLLQQQQQLLLEQQQQQIELHQPGFVGMEPEFDNMLNAEPIQLAEPGLDQTPIDLDSINMDEFEFFP